ncbi:MAG TPA: DUF11 domain-containing protein [Verrucomicrobiae bacterium]|nr:DUF11 domain-containing protein [Verrucomicrobiae bacterium]
MRWLLVTLVLALGVGQGHPAAGVVGPFADLAVSALALPGSYPVSVDVAPGETLTFDITVSNRGPSDAAGVVLRDEIPANTTFVSWRNVSYSQEDVPVITPAVGGTGVIVAVIGTLAYPTNPSQGSHLRKMFVLTVRVDPDTTVGSTIANTATVTSASIDPETGNNAATTTTRVSGPADLTLSVSNSPDPITAGSDLTYVIELTNAGPMDAESVTLTDYFDPYTTFVSFSQESGPLFTMTVPDGSSYQPATASIDALAAGAIARFNLVVNVNAPTGAVLISNATITLVTGDPDPTNNSVNIRSAVGPP